MFFTLALVRLTDPISESGWFLFCFCCFYYFSKLVIISDMTKLFLLKNVKKLLI